MKVFRWKNCYADVAASAYGGTVQSFFDDGVAVRRVFTGEQLRRASSNRKRVLRAPCLEIEVSMFPNMLALPGEHRHSPNPRAYFGCGVE
jgi:hypothetical protein